MYKWQLKQMNKNYIYFFGMFILFLLVLSPLLIYKYPILVDYPNHLASYYIQANIENDAWLKENYRVEWHIKPYLIVEALGGVLARYMDIFIAGRMIILFGIICIFLGAILIRKLVNGSIDYWMLIVTVFFFNNLLYWGLINYYVSSGLALIAMGAWISLRNISGLKNVLLFSLISTTLFFCHLFALGVYAIFVVSYEIGLYKSSKYSFIFSDVVKAIAQFIFPAILFFIWRSSLQQYEIGDFFVYGGWVKKFYSLLSPLYFDYKKYSFYLILLMLICTFLFRVFYHCRISIHDSMKAPLSIFLLISILTPVSLAGVYQTDLRLMFIFMVLLVASVKFDETDVKTENFRKSILSIVIIMLCLKTYFISDSWARIGRQYQEFEDALQYVKPGSKVITIQEDSKNTKVFDNKGLYHHMSALSIIKRSAFWPNLFTVNLTPIYPSATTKKIDTPLSDQLNLKYLSNIQVKNGYVYDKGKVVYWANWKNDFDYLIAIRFDDFSIIDIKELKLKVRGSFFDIYEIIH